jgi:ATP:corrinoid adenosyltransferase
MVRCVPAEPDFTTAAERDVWRAVKRRLGQDDALLANVRLTDEGGDYELDLVVGLAGAGIAVVEVKGGSVAHDGEGWVQTGAVTKPIDPVRQAREGKYALRAYLDGDPRWRRRVRLAHLVAFPYSRIDPGFALPDCPRWMVIDRDQLGDSAGLLWDAVQLQDTATPPARLADIVALVEIIGGRMLPQRDLLAEVAERDRQVDLLTERQAIILSALRLLPRVEIRGGSGSGKTWLAVEQASRLAGDGKRVALTCFNRGLASCLERRVAQLKPSRRPAYVGTFHRLGVHWGAPSGTAFDQDYWEQRLPAAMMDLARALPGEQRFDAVVIDEAQDFADSWVAAAARLPRR